MPRSFVVTVYALWALVLALIVAGSIFTVVPEQAPWDSPGLSHFLAYFAAGFLPMLLRPGWRQVIAILVGLVALGAGLEGVQTLLPDRYGTVVDALINACGVVAGMLAGGWSARAWLERVLGWWPTGR